MTIDNPPTKARTADSSRRREIIAAATEVFAQKGIVAATVRDIGGRAGILSGSLYYHFSSKEEIIVEILVPVLRSQVDAFDAIVAETGDPDEILERLILSAVLQTAANPHAARILQNETQRIRELALEDVTKLQVEVMLRWTSAVKQGINTGRFRADVDPRMASVSIADVVLGAYRFMRPMGRSSPAQVAAQLTALILNGLDTR